MKFFLLKKFGVWLHLYAFRILNSWFLQYSSTPKGHMTSKLICMYFVYKTTYVQNVITLYTISSKIWPFVQEIYPNLKKIRGSP